MPCISCGATFQSTQFEEQLRLKLIVPPPTHCPDCRRQRRLGAINQMHLFKSVCAHTGKPIITNIPPRLGLPTWSQQSWYSDAHDGKKYGKPFDFSRPFFDQFFELQKSVPRPALFTDFQRDVNSAYTNYAAGSKSCYLIFQSGYNEDCYYGYFVEYCKSVVDCFQVHKSELCYECTNCNSCYSSAFLHGSEGCRDSFFLDSCISCTRCIFCVNLKHKDLHIFNKKVSEEEFLRTRKLLSQHAELQKAKGAFEKFRSDFPRKSIRALRCEDVDGDGLENCKRAYRCFDSQGVEDGMFLTQCFVPFKDALDCDGCGQGEIVYEGNQSGMNGFNLRWTIQCIEQVRDLTYCDTCLQSHDLFGCVGMRRAEFCVFNTQYSKDEYQELVCKITEHMKATGEWGEFFPLKNSLAPYNLSMAAVRYPLTKEEII